MKPFNNTSNQGLGGLFAVLLGLLSMNAAHAQIFVVNTSADTIGEYTNSGATVNASLVSGLSVPWGIAVSGSNLFVTNQFNSQMADGTIGEYNAITGAAVNASLVSGLNEPLGIAVSGSNLFVTNGYGGTTGAGTIGEYNAITGATVNASLVSGLNYPVGIAVSGSDLFVTNANPGTIGEYTTSGATVNASLISGSGFYPTNIAVSAAPVSAPVPEPSTYAMMLAGLALIGFIAYRRKNNSSNMLMAA